MSGDEKCSRCGEMKMKSWSELTEDEREVVKRLPASAEYSAASRQAAHRWCTRCWNEEKMNGVKA